MMFFSMIPTSFIIIFIKHTLSLGFSILMYTTLIKLTLGLFSSFWYLYMLYYFLISIGGLLVSFIYMTSIASIMNLLFPHMWMMMPWMTHKLMNEKKQLSSSLKMEFLL